MTREVTLGSWLVLGLVAFVTLGALVYSQIATPIARESIEDFGANVPAASRFALEVAEPVIAIPGVLVFLGLLVAKERYFERKMVCLLLNNVALVLTLAAFVCYRDAIAYPLLQLIRNLSD